MKAQTLLFASLVALCACNRTEPSSSVAKAPAESATPATPAAKPAARATPAPVAPAELARIAGSGHTGLWADIDGICLGKRQSAMLMWNVPVPASTQVELYRIKPDGTERLLARGSAVGERRIGRWLNAGMTFVVRAKGGTQELGRLVIAGKHC